MTGRGRPPARILLTHAKEAREKWYGDRALAELRATAEVLLNPRDRPFTIDELIEAAGTCSVIVSDRATPGDAAIFGNLPGLVAFVRGQVDIRNVDVAAASTAGILVTQASRGFVAAVAEWIVGAMIAASRHIVHYSAAYRKGEEPAAIVGRQLAGSTIGIIGYGAIAEHLCGLAHAFGMRVLVTDPYKGVPAPFEPVDLATLLSQSDFVVPLAVANEETDDMIDAAALAQMQPHAWLINASRGNLIDEAALEAALDAGRIAGAFLDVGRAPDQKPSPHLASRADVIASPHIGGLTPQALEHQALETVRQAASILRGEMPVGAVNAEHAARLAWFRL